MNPPLIGITTYGRNEENHFSLPTKYVDAVRRAGGIPILMPPGEPNVDSWIRRMDALILTGGGDLEAVTYGGDGHELNYKVDGDRDRDEMHMVRHMVDTDLPCLAICRGIQILNVAYGGDLIEHLPDVVGEEVAHRTAEHDPIDHAVEIVPDSHLARALGHTQIQVKSWHHQAIGKLGEGLQVVAKALDGTIEAVEMPSHPGLLAVQWHPELTAAEDPIQQKLFDYLVA